MLIIWNTQIWNTQTWQHATKHYSSLIQPFIYIYIVFKTKNGHCFQFKAALSVDATKNVIFNPRRIGRPPMLLRVHLQPKFSTCEWMKWVITTLVSSHRFDQMLNLWQLHQPQNEGSLGGGESLSSQGRETKRKRDVITQQEMMRKCTYYGSLSTSGGAIMYTKSVVYLLKMSFKFKHCWRSSAWCRQIGLTSLLMVFAFINR